MGLNLQDSLISGFWLDLVMTALARDWWTEGEGGLGRPPASVSSTDVGCLMKATTAVQHPTLYRYPWFLIPLATLDLGY